MGDTTTKKVRRTRRGMEHAWVAHVRKASAGSWQLEVDGKKSSCHNPTAALHVMGDFGIHLPGAL